MKIRKCNLCMLLKSWSEMCIRHIFASQVSFVENLQTARLRSFFLRGRPCVDGRFVICTVGDLSINTSSSCCSFFERWQWQYGTTPCFSVALYMAFKNMMQFNCQSECQSNSLEALTDKNTLTDPVNQRHAVSHNGKLTLFTVLDHFTMIHWKNDSVLVHKMRPWICDLVRCTLASNGQKDFGKSPLSSFSFDLFSPFSKSGPELILCHLI